MDKREPTIFLDYTEQQGGFEKPPDGLNQEKCPKCGDDTIVMFGLYGGGYGTSVCCNSCDWFYKKQEEHKKGPDGAI